MKRIRIKSYTNLDISLTSINGGKKQRTPEKIRISAANIDIPESSNISYLPIHIMDLQTVSSSMHRKSNVS